jgi:BirA family biotin operon repressor/biotin-[acetyl-CoA-carboxylase] ligase
MIGNKVISLQNINSTNLYAARLVENESPPEGTVVMAGYQEKGKGQRDAIWESEAGQNLLCSVILFPVFMEIANQFLLNQAVSLAVTSVVDELAGVKAEIKWPNDVLVNEKKIAGILLENNLRGNLFASCVAGIGLNINQRVFRNYSYAAVSLASLTGKSYPVKECSELLFSKLDYFYDLLKKHEYEMINDAYMNHLFRLNEPAMFEINGKPSEAIIRGVRPEGELVLEMPDGLVRYIRTREVKYLF